MTWLRHRLATDEGYTMIELLIVIGVLAVLVAIAVPSYLGFAGRAQGTSAKANVRAAVPSAEAFYSDHETYSGLTTAAVITNYDSGLSASVSIEAVNGDHNYCISAPGQGTTVWYFYGPGGSVTSTKPTNC